jgi:sporulation protein YlmC with PRC-barrel domain
VLSAGLQLLDRQIVDRDGKRCGKVDDVELARADDGTLHVTAVLSGPGALAYRMGRHRLGRWLQHTAGQVFDGALDGRDPVRIPFGRIADIGDHVTVAADRAQLATFAVERWVRDHVVGHIPGSGHDATE